MPPTEFVILISALLFGPAGGVWVYNKLGINGLRQTILENNSLAKESRDEHNRRFTHIDVALDELLAKIQTNREHIVALEADQRSFRGWVRRIEEDVQTMRHPPGGGL